MHSTTQIILGLAVFSLGFSVVSCDKRSDAYQEELYKIIVSEKSYIAKDLKVIYYSGNCSEVKFIDADTHRRVVIYGPENVISERIK